MTIEPSPQPVPQPMADRALQLYLAGVSADQIAATLRLPLDAVDEALAVALEARQPGRTLETAAEVEQLQALWRRAYTDALAGDQRATALALAIADRIADVRSRPGVVAEPETALGGIRDAWNGLASGSVEAAETLLQLVRHGKSESVRQRAAATLLSRVGITERVELATSVRMATQAADVDDASTVGRSAADVVHSRLDDLAERRRRIEVIDADVDPLAAVVTPPG